MTLCPTPANAGQLTSDDPMGSRSCVAYSAAYAICLATNGRLSPDGATIRQWTGDISGGLELDQVDRAVLAHTGLNFDIQTVTLAAHEARMATGKWVSVTLGGYGPISVSAESGQPFFKGNHAICEPPLFEEMDPLADGRRPGIYKYHGAPYPASLRRAFYAALRLGNGHAAGPDHVEAMYLRIESPATPPPVHRAVVTKRAKLAFYSVDSKGVAHTALVIPTGGFSGTCTAPHLYPWHSQRLRLVSMTSGSYSKGQYKGLYLNAGSVKVT